MTKRWPFLSCVALPAHLLLSTASTLPAQTIIKVTTTADDLLPNGNCSLREAVFAANMDTARDACPAGSGADRIHLRPGVYTLDIPNGVSDQGENAGLTGDLDILDSLTIHGAGPALTVINGGRMDRVIDVVSPSAMVLFSGLTIGSGDSPDSEGGGGVRNRGRLTLRRVNVIGNFTCCQGGGIANEYGAHLLIFDSTIASNVGRFGGGIANYGDVRVQVDEHGHTVSGQTRIFHNVGVDIGGGIDNRGALWLDSTAVTANLNDGAGGGITNSGMAQISRSEISDNSGGHLGGGIHNSDSLMLRDSTVADNFANQGGGLNNFGMLAATNVTVSGNWAVHGSSLANYGTAELRHATIVGEYLPQISTDGSEATTRLLATLIAGPVDNWPTCHGPIVSLGNNLDNDGSCGLSAPGDLPSTDPLLGPLADHGGLTQTYALLPGSPAVDRIPSSQCTVAADQRGVARPQAPKRGACDIGAYELSPPGDIKLMIEEVLRLGAVKVLTQPQVNALIGGLELAFRDAMRGSPASACARLDDFTTTLSSFVDDGSLTQEVAVPLLTAARVNGLVCA